MRMSMTSRLEYLSTMCQRYHRAGSRKEKSQIIEEVVSVLGYHRKYAIQILNNGPSTTRNVILILGGRIFSGGDEI